MNRFSFNFDFYGNRRKFFTISLAVLAIGLIFNIIFGTKLDMQFAGGAMVRYEVTGGEVSSDEVKDIVAESLEKDVSVTVNNAIDSDGQQVIISFAGNQNISVDQQQLLAETLTEEYAELSFRVVESSSVDPVMGAQFLQKGIACLLITFGLLLLYIAARFRKIGGLSAGLTALASMLHNVLAAYFVFVIFGLEVNDIFIAVVLTILGYSLNDTIVVYDRIRENRKLMGPKADYAEVTNLSLNQTIGRSIMTSLCTFAALLVVFIVALIFQLDSVLSFALPMMVGVIAGCYSSPCIAATIYTMWQYKSREKKAAKKKGKNK